MTFEYNAIRFTPKLGAADLFLSACPADEIVQWADAPHKQVGIRAGYQRELDDNRTENIQEFLRASAANVLPSAALIALRAGTYEFQTKGDISVLTIRADERPREDRRLALLREFEARLSPSELVVDQHGSH